MVDGFFADGEGSEFADRSAMDTAISDLRGLEGQGQIAEGNIVTAQDNLAAFFSGLNSDSALNLKDGTVYTVSGDIADEAAALETLLNDDEDAVYAVDRVTGFLESQDRAIADLDDLNGQIDHSVVMREMSVSDAAPQLVSLDEAEVDRLGEGSVQIEARQTDAVGNVHEGGPATSSFVIDTIDPSTLDAPAVTLGLVTDADDGTTLTVTFGFDEAMDQGVAPTVTFDPDLESTLTGQTGRWTDAQTYVVEAVVADADFDADEVTIDITGAQDVAGNIQEDHTATVGLSVDTQNPTSSSITIDVADSDQTDGDAAESFTVSTSDLDPGMLHVEMRGSEFTALTSIKSDYLNDVSAKIGGLQTAASDAQGFEGALTAAEEARDAFFNNATASDPSGSAAVFSTSGDIDVEASRVEGIAAELSRLEDVSSDADGARDVFFTEGNPGAGHASSAEIGAEALRVEGLGDDFADLETALSDAQGDRDVFFTDGAGAGHASSTEIGDEALRVEGLGDDFADLETALSDAQDDFAAFFDDSTDPVGPGSAFDDIQAIGDEASRLETKAATLRGSAADEMNEAAAALRDLEVEAQGLEDAIADAQGEVDSFFAVLFTADDVERPLMLVLPRVMRPLLRFFSDDVVAAASADRG